MKWRCPQCGKPHEKNDPPCDNCGHHKFERAVVPQATAEDDHEQFVWACSECGRHHQRNNPPCSRCGNATFEKKALDYDEFDPGTTSSYRELAGKQELAAVLVILGFVVVGALGFLGVVDIPGITPQEPPTVQNVPGNASSVDGVSLDVVERSYLEGVNEQRETAGRPRLSESGTLENVATFYNQRRVKADYADGTIPSGEELRSKFDVSCNAVVYAPDPVALNRSESGLDARSLGELLAVDSPVADRGGSRTGLDVHVAPDGQLYLTQVLC